MALKSTFLDSFVPITLFNKGQASRIFDRLQSESQLIVLKNNSPSAVILSPEEYSRLAEIEEDYALLLEATRRLETNQNTFSFDEVLSELNITKEELYVAEDPELGCK